MSDITDPGYGYEAGVYSRRLDAALDQVEKLQSACAELKQFIGESEMPMHESFSYDQSIKWREKREYLLSNQAGEQLLERLNKASDLIQRCVDTGLLRTDETRQLWDEANEFLKL